MKIYSVLALFLVVLLLFTGCYRVADSDYSLPAPAEIEEESSEKTEIEDSEEQSNETETRENGQPSISEEEFLLSYVPKIYNKNEEFHLYQRYGDDEESSTIDLNIQVTEFTIGEQILSSEFDYLDVDFRPFYECESNEEIVYYTLEITAGEMHSPNDANYLTSVNGTRLFSVRQDYDSVEFHKLFDFDYAFFSPIENYDSIHDAGKISLTPGETKKLTYAEKIKKDDLKKDIFLEIDFLGTNLLDPDNTKPEDLTEEQRSMIAICKVWEGME